MSSAPVTHAGDLKEADREGSLFKVWMWQADVLGTVTANRLEPSCSSRQRAVFYGFVPLGNPQLPLLPPGTFRELVTGRTQSTEASVSVRHSCGLGTMWLGPVFTQPQQNTDQRKYKDESFSPATLTVGSYTP